MVAIRKEKISEGKMIKLLIDSIYKIFFMVALLWFMLACAAVEVGAGLGNAVSLGGLGLVCLLISILLHTFVDNPKRPRKKK